MSLPSFPWMMTRHQFFSLPPAPKGKLLDGQTVIVTGANSGIGLEATKQMLALSPAKMILAVRNVEAGQKLAVDFTKRFDTSTDVQVWKLDVLDFKSVAQFVERALKELSRLDVLVNNAGINPGFGDGDFKASVDGYERVIQTNLLSPILLALSLRPLLERTAALKGAPRPRLIFTGSDTHIIADPTPIVEAMKNGQNILVSFNDPNNFINKDRYFQSKLLLQMATNALIPGLPEFTIINVNPGLCRSNLGREFDLKPSFSLLKFVLLYFLTSRSSYAGAKSLSTASVYAEESHQYWTECGPYGSECTFLPSLSGIMSTKKLFDEILLEMEKLRPGVTEGVRV